VLAGGGTSQITPVASTVYVTQQPSASGTSTVLLPPGATQNDNAAPTSTSTPSTSPLPTIHSHSKSSTPIGAIVGGVIGGITLIAFLSFLLWFYLRKRKQDKAFALAAAQNEQQEADAATAIAFQNHNRISELGGTHKPTNTYIQPPSPRLAVFSEKQTAGANTAEAYGPQGYGNQSVYGENLHTGSPQSPPPIYTQPPQSNPSIPSPPSNYTELEEQRTGNGPPVSPPLSQTGYMGQDQGQRLDVNELGGANRGSLNVPQGVQEMSASTGGINRRPVGGSRTGAGQWVDMSGAPMSEEFHSHELE